MDDQTEVTRTVELDLAPADAWDLVATAAGWERWLCDRADLAVADGSGGSVEEDGAVRRVQVDEIDIGARVRFRWWPEGDDARTSQVELEVLPHAGGSLVRVREVYPAQAPTPRSAARWDVRATCLAGAGSTLLALV